MFLVLAGILDADENFTEADSEVDEQRHSEVSNILLLLSIFGF